MNKNSLPGWKINIDEISNGVFKVTLTDSCGRKAEKIDFATDETVERAISDAFEIEKQISQNWNLFLYEFAIQKLVNSESKHKEFNENAFGSWIIETQDKRLLYDGNESWLIFQTKSKNDWNDLRIIKKDEIRYSNFVEQIKDLK